MSHESPLPGSSHHQTLLKTIITLYENRDDIQAVLVFGSLGKGSWDDNSDLDLAVIAHNNVQVDMPVELERVRAALAGQGEQALFVRLPMTNASSSYRHWAASLYAITN